MTSNDLEPTPIPVTIVAGFLGAGKTTLLNHILTAEHGRRVGVLVNDFGSINVDAELVSEVEDGMMTLANGCVCCAIRVDLIQAVLNCLIVLNHPRILSLNAAVSRIRRACTRPFLSRKSAIRYLLMVC